MGAAHQTVLKQEVVDAILPTDGGVYLDCTVGWGGHSEALLQASGPAGRVIGIDRDPVALEAAGERLAPFGSRFQSFESPFGAVAPLLEVLNIDGVDGLVADLGVSSPQIDRAERGFSFMQEGPLDMRMGPDVARTAADLVEESDESTLARILWDFGEERHARRIARAIAGKRFETTLDLVRVLDDCIPVRGYQRIHPATRTFQALRIVVNDELGQLDQLLENLLSLLRPGGRAALISFHSLEDRRVKRAFRLFAGEGGEKDAYGDLLEPPQAQLIGRRAVRSTDESNPRSRSARMRVLERLPEPEPSC
jgi:16S rRNA (cytosine1402-N4)-methyltransferase